MFKFGQYLTINNIIAVILIIVGLIWLIHGLLRNRKINRINSWPKVNAYVLNSFAEPANNSAGDVYIDPRYLLAYINDSAKFIPRVIYRYRLNGIEYQSDNVIYSGYTSYDSLNVKTLLGHITTGSTIPVFYNPNDPKESYIYNGDKSYSGIVIGLILLAAGGYLVYNHFNKNKYGKGVKTRTKIGTENISTPGITELSERERKELAEFSRKVNPNQTRTTFEEIVTTRGGMY